MYVTNPISIQHFQPALGLGLRFMVCDGQQHPNRTLRFHTWLPWHEYHQHLVWALSLRRKQISGYLYVGDGDYVMHGSCVESTTRLRTKRMFFPIEMRNQAPAQTNFVLQNIWESYDGFLSQFTKLCNDMLALLFNVSVMFDRNTPRARHVIATVGWKLCLLWVRSARVTKPVSFLYWVLPQLSLMTGTSGRQPESQGQFMQACSQYWKLTVNILS